MDRKYPVFVLGDGINDAEINYHDTLSWCWGSLQNGKDYI